jgi:hypothetical protein
MDGWTKEKADIKVYESDNAIRLWLCQKNNMQFDIPQIQNENNILRI